MFVQIACSVIHILDCIDRKSFCKMENMKTTHGGIPIPIPGRLNILISLAAFSFALACLYGASVFTEWWQVALCAVGFAFVGNTIFSLLHEAVHRIFYPNLRVNDIFGQLCAMFFPTGFFFQRAFHLGHHRRNRTDVEMFDMYYPDDSRFLKFVQLYTVLLGFYWTAAPLGGIFYLISPKILDTALFRNQNKYIKPMSMDAMLSGLDKIDSSRVRWELLVTLLFQLGIIFILGVSLKAWFICYWSFAVLWGSLQYADHAWSVRDIRKGAWNLKVNKLVQFIFLNYHHHLAHHEYPYVPWIHLHKFVDYTAERPSHLKIWLKMWKGPTLTTERSPQNLPADFEKVLYQGLNSQEGPS